MYNDNMCNVMDVFGEEEWLNRECHTIVKYSIISGIIVVFLFLVVIIVLSSVICHISRKMKAMKSKIRKTGEEDESKR